ncbi:MAG: hypothetical protein HW421_3947 [Ignavibacteria bacterium]|nr:hypothetical protein [Ignavibacteria bacterium]
MKTKTKIFKGNQINIINDPNQNQDDELRDEYDLSSMKLKPNPFVSKNKVIIELEPEVARYFKTTKQVNDYLRNQIKQFQKVIL